MEPTPDAPTPEEAQEIDSMLHHFGGIDGMPRLYSLMDGQLSVIHQRATALISLCSVVITVTGFSGRIIADTNIYSQILIISGIALVGIGAAITLVRVMPIRWLTSYMNLSVEQWLLTALRRRQRKNRALLVALLFVAAGMALYLTAISTMLLYPEATELTRVR